MKRNKIIALACLFLLGVSGTMKAQKNEPKTYIPWANGKLVVDESGRYLKQANGAPFFWLGDTGWLMPARLDRDEVEYYLEQCSKKGFNMVQIMLMHTIPEINTYGQWALPDGFNFKNIDKKGVYGYWDHIDFILRTAERKGIYIGMVCLWGTPVSKGLVSEKDAQAYGKFLADRYKNNPNIVWFIGGDIRGDVKPTVWHTLARTIKANDENHLMTFHPRGRTTSAVWFNDAEWLDFNMFQSGHRRYGQRLGDGDYTIQENTEEDNWRYVEKSFAMKPLKPTVDGEPVYEEIPQGLHDTTQPLWNANDIRRYAYWSVFAGSFGHTYGHNSIMQMLKNGVGGAYGATKPWYDALKDPGMNQMKYLKNLMLTFPYFDRVPDQTVIAGTNGELYERVIATRGNDYLMAYNYTNRPVQIDLTKISGAKKKVWWYNPSNGELQYAGEFDNKVTEFIEDSGYRAGNDRVLIAVDSSKDYIKQDWTSLPDAQQKWNKK